MELNKSEEKKPLSFGFSKRQETKQLVTSVVGEYEDREKAESDKDFVLSLEKNKVKSTKPTQKTSKEYVIPLIKQNRWRVNTSDVPISDHKNDLDLIAAQEILEDSAKLNGEWDERGELDTGSSKPIPLLMQNKVPEGFETDNTLNVQLRPEQPKDADYDQIPIEHFGMALLRGMGWKEGMGVGKNAKVVAPLEAQLRPKGLGLGADKSNEPKKDNATNSHKSNETEENLELKSGAYCIVLSGHNKDLYGKVEGVDEDNARVMVKLSVSGKVVNLMQCAVQLVSKENFEKHSKYLNKHKVDKYKENELSKKEKEHSSKNNNSGRNNIDDDRVKDFQNGSSDRKESKKRKDLHPSSRDEYEDKYRNKKHKHKHHKHHKNKSSRKYSEYNNSDSEDEVKPDSDTKRPWIQKDLRVRVIDKNLKGGKYYKEKVIVEDVPSPDFCVCKTSDGRVIENVSQSSLETVVPRGDGATVIIITGSHHGQLGHIMKRDKEKCLALVQLLTDRDLVLKLHYDEICEYVGDVHFVE